MIYLLLGILALALWLTAARAFTQANPAVLALQLRRLAGAVMLAFAAFFALRNAFIPFVLFGIGGWWLLGGRLSIQSMLDDLRRRFGGSSAGPAGASQVSRIVTDHLEAELDHATGEMRGRVLKGIFEGRRIENLKPVDLALLWQDCRFTDQRSAQIVEAYLDRMHPTWRDDLARGEREMANGPGGRMGPEEALEILGLKAGASDDDIRKAHRELMLKFHPDRGGSTYLAAKINEAKDVLLERG